MVILISFSFCRARKIWNQNGEIFNGAINPIQAVGYSKQITAIQVELFPYKIREGTCLVSLKIQLGVLR